MILYTTYIYIGIIYSFFESITTRLHCLNIGHGKTKQN